MATKLQRELAAAGAAPAGPGLAVSVRGLVRRFGERTVIRSLDLDIRTGEFVALLGASGCGKSTLLRILADLDHEIEGRVRVSPQRAVAFQAPRLFPWKRVWSNVVTGLEGPRDRARADAALAEVGLRHRGDAWPGDLSGGEAQRVSLARALVRKPDLLLLDEPFAALDALTRIKAQTLVADLWQRHRQAVLLVTHDVDEALLLADRILVMREGEIAHEVAVSQTRPRQVGDPAFADRRAQLLAWLGVGHAAELRPPRAAPAFSSTSTRQGHPMAQHTIDADQFRQWLEDGQELAVLDLRDEAGFAKGAPLYATNLPAERLEKEFDRFVPRAGVRTVLVDAGEGTAERLAERLAAAGRTSVSALAGGIPAWNALGAPAGLTFDTPGQQFSLGIRDEKGTPVLTAAELRNRRDRGEDIAVLDTRTLAEFNRSHVPGAIGVPGAELLLRFADLVPSPATTVVVSCAGLPRAIIGAQTLIDAGVPNRVFYLDRGTAGWRDAGLPLEEGVGLTYEDYSGHAARAADSYTGRLRQLHGIAEIDEATARAWQADAGRTTYLLDVRSPSEFAAGHLAGTLSAEGGQLLGVAHRTIAVRGARVVLIDDLHGARAATTAHWLRRRGYEIAILRHAFAAEPAVLA